MCVMVVRATTGHPSSGTSTQEPHALFEQVCVPGQSSEVLQLCVSTSVQTAVTTAVLLNFNFAFPFSMLAKVIAMFFVPSLSKSISFISPTEIVTLNGSEDIVMVTESLLTSIISAVWDSPLTLKVS